MPAILRHEESRIIRNQDAVLQRQEDGTGVLLNLATKYYFSLNQTATFIWGYIEKHDRLTVGDLYAEMLQTYEGVDEDTLTNDINEFIEMLNAEGMVSLDH